MTYLYRPANLTVSATAVIPFLEGQSIPLLKCLMHLPRPVHPWRLVDDVDLVDSMTEQAVYEISKCNGSNSPTSSATWISDATFGTERRTGLAKRSPKRHSAAGQKFEDTSTLRTLQYKYN